jgi:hypothetical protein
MGRDSRYFGLGMTRKAQQEQKHKQKHKRYAYEFLSQPRGSLGHERVGKQK